MEAIYTLIKPVVTEKATNQSARFTYAFWVNRKATKIDIKHAIKEAYGVEVASVRIINSPAKKRLMRRMLIDKRPPMKKALITLRGRKKLDVTKLLKSNEKD